MKLINPANGRITGELIFDTDESMGISSKSQE